MRRLASELGVDPMSLYHHLPSKSAVVAGLVELVFSEMQLPSRSGPWEDRVYAWAGAYRRLARDHPGLVLQVVADSAAVSSAMLLISNPLYEALSDAGLLPRSTINVAGTVVDFVNGFVLAEASQPRALEKDQTILNRIRAEPASAIRALRRVHEALEHENEPLSFDSGFQAGIDLIIAGTTALHRSRPPNREGSQQATGNDP